jgi:hypothetical protein
MLAAVTVTSVHNPRVIRGKWTEVSEENVASIFSFGKRTEQETGMKKVESRLWLILQL